MIFAVFDLSPLTVCINCSFYIYICCFITSFNLAIKNVHKYYIFSFKISTAGPVLRHHAKCCADRSNRCRDIMFGFFRMSAADILDFLNFEFVTVQTVKRVELRHSAKFR